MKDLKDLPTGTQEIKILYIQYRVSGKYNITCEMKIVFESWGLLEDSHFFACRRIT